MRRPGRILGLDLSLTCTGMCVLSRGWKAAEWHHVTTRAVKIPIAKAATPEQLGARLVSIVAEVSTFAFDRWNVQHAFVEDYAHGALGSSHTKLAELRGAVVVELARRGLYLKPLSIGPIRQYLIGDGSPRKESKIRAELLLRRAGLVLATTDEYDAFAVANYGLATLGGVGVSFPKNA